MPDSLANGAPVSVLRRKPARREIRLSASELPRVILESFDALTEQDENLYVRAGVLVTVAREPEREEAYAGDRRVGPRVRMRPGTPRIAVIGLPEVQERLAVAANFSRFDPNAGEAPAPVEGQRRGKPLGEWVACGPGKDLAGHVVGRCEKPGVRPIDVLAEAPYLRADGNVVQVPGYDRQSACVYLPGIDFPRVPERPSIFDARKALAELREPFAEFPFREGADRDVPIAAVMTLLARPAILGAVPMVDFDATTRGSGKSLLADCVATIATGRGAPRMTWAENAEEQEKVLGAYALQGASLICFDNVTGPICGGPLDKVLTAPHDAGVSLRVLGRSEVPTHKWTALVMATGNNIVIKGDTERRSLVARLEPGADCENPEERDNFKHPDLLAWIRENRPRLVVAALTILRAYVAAGRPAVPGIRAWGSFEAWTALIPAALTWAGGANIMDCRPTMREGEGDPDKQALLAILEHWPRIDVTGHGITMRAALALLYSADRMRGEAPPDGFDDLREALEALAPAKDGRGVDAKHAGIQMQRLARRWCSGKRMVKGAPGHGGAVRWRVATPAEPEAPKAEVQPVAEQTPAEPAAAAEPAPVPPLDVSAILTNAAATEAAFLRGQATEDDLRATAVQAWQAARLEPPDPAEDFERG